MNNLLLIPVAIIVAFNLISSFILIKSASYSSNQKLALLFLIWLLPLIGAVLVYSFIKSDQQRSGPNDPPFGGGDNGGIGESHAGSD